MKLKRIHLLLIEKVAFPIVEGLVEYARERAEATKNKWDDVLVRALEGGLEAARELLKLEKTGDRD